MQLQFLEEIIFFWRLEKPLRNEFYRLKNPRFNAFEGKVNFWAEIIIASLFKIG
jgi:hypothetical protein